MRDDRPICIIAGCVNLRWTFWAEWKKSEQNNNNRRKTVKSKKSLLTVVKNSSNHVPIPKICAQKYCQRPIFIQTFLSSIKKAAKNLVELFLRKLSLKITTFIHKITCHLVFFFSIPIILSCVVGLVFFSLQRGIFWVVTWFLTPIQNLAMTVLRIWYESLIRGFMVLGLAFGLLDVFRPYLQLGFEYRNDLHL